FEYVSAWWSVHGASYGVFTPVVCDGERVVAVLPLIIHRGVLHFFCFTDADFFDLLCENGLEQRSLALILSELDKHRSEWKWAVLNNLPQSSALLQSEGWA